MVEFPRDFNQYTSLAALPFFCKNVFNTHTEGKINMGPQQKAVKGPFFPKVMYITVNITHEFFHAHHY